MSTNANKRKKVNVFGDEGDEPNAKFNEAIDTVRHQQEGLTSSTVPTVPPVQPAVQQSSERQLEQQSTEEPNKSRQTIQKTDYFTQEQLDKLDDLEYLIKKRRGRTLRRFEILGLLVEQCNIDTFIENV